MAKSTGFFTLRSGSTKNFTFSRLDGKQITKERVSEVKNPRTELQMRQRMLLATIGAGYSFMKAIADHSYEGYTTGMACMRRFMSLNLDNFKAASEANAAVALNAYKDKAVNPLPFILAQGSLTFDFGLDDGNHISVVTSDAAADLTTAEGVYAALGVQKGDLITFVYVHGTSHIESGVYSYTPDGFYIVRLTCDKSGDVATPLKAFTIQSNRDDAVVNVNANGNILTIASGLADFGAVILSRKSDSKWLRSNAVMVVNPNVISGVKVNNQLVTYPTGEELVLNGAAMSKSNASTAKAIPQLAVSPSSVSVTKGSTVNVPSVTGVPDGAAVTYSYAESYISIAGGVITPKKNGTVTVTVKTAATDEYAASSIKFNVVVSGFDDSTSGGGDSESVD